MLDTTVIRTCFTMMNCCTSLPEVSVAHRYFLQPNAFDGPTIPEWTSFVRAAPDAVARFEAYIGNLNKALDALRAARPTSPPRANMSFAT